MFEAINKLHKVYESLHCGCRCGRCHC